MPRLTIRSHLIMRAGITYRKTARRISFNYPSIIVRPYPRARKVWQSIRDHCF